jgi:PAS domain S-box-containing protein
MDDAPDLPTLLAGRPAATLLVDLTAGTVTFANALATELAPGVALPVSLARWSMAAGLRDGSGAALEGPGGLRLLDLARGAPSRGVEVSAARGSDASFPREPLWAIGIPLDDAPAPLAHQALVVLLPRREESGVTALADLGADLHARAASASDLSFTISDPTQPDDPLIWVNPAFERVTGYSAAEALGHNCRFLQGPDTDRDAVRSIREALAESRTVADTLLNYKKDGTPFWNQVVISPVLDAAGNVTHHVGIQADVTDRVAVQRARDQQLLRARDDGARLRLLARVTEVLARHLDYTQAVRALTEVVVDGLATWGYVAVVNERGRFERLHVAAADSARAADAQALEEMEPSWIARAPSVQAALAGGAEDLLRPYPIDVGSLPERTTPEQLELLTRLGLGTALVVPLRARERVLGVLVLVQPPGRDFDPQHVLTAAHVAHRAGLGLENVRLYERERATALTLQRRMLPELPTVEGIDVAATYLPAQHPAEVGGDWFDVLPLPDGAVGFAVGDVVGHDMAAAASMGQLRSVLRSYAWGGQSSGQVIDHLDELVRGLSMADIATCVYLRLLDGRVQYTRAGHPPPMVLLPGGEVIDLDAGLRTPVGVPAAQGTAPTAEVDLPEGALLVAYSDGLVERRDRPLREGLAQLRTALAATPPGSTATDVRDRLVGALLGPVLEDDVCVLVVRRP